MTYRSSISFIAGLVLSGSLTASPFAATHAVAQEAIMLETIGAVRMARPEEVERKNHAATVIQQRGAAPTTAAPDRHAAVVD